jgi:hypothetical protein
LYAAAAARVQLDMWAQASVDLSPFAGQTVKIVVQAADASTASLVEAAVDDVRVTGR